MTAGNNGKHSKRQLAQMKRDKEYWEELSSKLGWRVGSFSRQDTATLYTDDTESLRMTFRQRDTLARHLGIVSLRDPFTTRAEY